MNIAKLPELLGRLNALSRPLWRTLSRRGLLIAAISVGVFVFLLRMPITGHMAGIATER